MIVNKRPYATTPNSKGNMEVVLLIQLAEEYLTLLTTSRRLALCTKRNSAAGVKRLVASLPQSTVLADLTPERMRAWFAQYEAAPHSANSTRQQYSACAALFQYAAEQGILLFDPLARVELPRKANIFHETLTQEQAFSLLTATGLIVDPTKRLRAKAFFAVLLYAGLRRSEANDLKLNDVFVAEGRIEVRSGKGGKAATVKVPRECMDAVRDWLRVRPTTSKHNYVFCANAYERMGRDTIHKLYQEVYHLAGVPLPQRPAHILRSVLATRIILNGGTIYDAQAALRHAQLATTVADYASKYKATLEGREHLASFAPPEPPAPTPGRRDARFHRRQVNRER
jgi:site-specific recombinase XerD